LIRGVTITGKEPEMDHNEVTIIGFVREIQDRGKSYRVGIAVGDEIYMVTLNEEAKTCCMKSATKLRPPVSSQRRKTGSVESMSAFMKSMKWMKTILKNSESILIIISKINYNSGYRTFGSD
jgi:hypothetical protein